MIKKAYQLFALLLLSAFMLVGCDGLVQTSFKPLQTVETDYSVWEFYRSMQSFYETMTDEYEEIEDQTSDSYKELYETFDNKTNIDRIVRDSMVVLDLFYERQDEAVLMFDGIDNYIAQKDESISKNGYRITYGEELDWHKVVGGESEIDEFMAKLVLPLSITATISTNIAGDDAEIQSGYTLDIVQTATFPENAEELNGQKIVLLPDRTDTQGHHTTYNFEYSQTSTVFIATAGKVVTDVAEQVLSSYSRQIKIEKKNNINYLTSTVTFADSTISEKVYRLDQQIRNITLGYDKQVGSLQWNINYTGSGQLMIFGEAYYQGKNKFFVKEEYKVVSSTPAPYAITQTFTTELVIDGEVYKYKYLPGETVYKHLYEEDVNILKFGLYNDDPVAITLQRVSSLPMIQFYN